MSVRGVSIIVVLGGNRTFLGKKTCEDQDTKAKCTYRKSRRDEASAN